MNMRLNTKLLLTIVFTTAIIYIVSIGYIGLRMKKVSLEDATKMANGYAAQFGNQVKADLKGELNTAITIAQSFEAMDDLPPQSKFNESIHVLRNIFVKRANYKGLWTSWERSDLDPSWDKGYGRYRIDIHRNYGTLITKLDTLNMYGDDINGLYYKLKTGKMEAITDPYVDTYDGVKVMVASVAAPILNKEGRFIGLTGIDFSLANFQSMLKTVHPFSNSLAFLVSNDGVFVANQKEDLVGTNIEDMPDFTENNVNILHRIKKGKAFSTDYTDQNGERYFVSFAPVKISANSKVWMAGISIPYKDINAEASNVMRVSSWAGLAGLFVLVMVIALFSRSITRPLEHINKSLQFLAKGEINKVEKLDFKSRDEIGDIATSSNTLIDGLRNTANFANEIGKGNLDVEFEENSEDDILGKALKSMRHSLIKARDEENMRREKEEEQKWVTAGQARFGEILRHSSEDLEEFTFRIISNLVKYTGSNQGAIFMVNDSDENDVFIEMVSCYAYDRKKYANKRIEIGEGLVGQCVQEGEMIYMTDVPDDYVNITSGLGEANPRAIILMPLKFNDKIYGVIEMASFEPYPEYKIDFISKISESIASTISSVKTNLTTIKLLEESKLKSEELAAQEEEMRQNMEELQTTQEESLRRETEMNGILRALNSSYLVAELDLEANFINVNDNALTFLGLSRELVEGKNLRMLLTQDEIDEFNELWKRVLNGETVQRQRKVERAVGTVWISESYTPIYDINEEMYKVLNLGTRIDKD